MKKENFKERITVSDERFLEIFNLCSSVKEIVERSGMSDSAVRRRIKKLELETKNIKNKVEINIDLFSEYNSQGLSDKKLGEIFNCSESAIARYRKNNNLPKIKKSELDKQKILNLHREGKTNYEISELIELSYSRTSAIISELGLTSNRKIQIYPKFTDVHYQVILGSVLGDTYLGKGTEAFGTCNHCLEQSEYMFYKYGLILELANKPKLVHKYDGRLKIPHYDQLYMYIRQHPSLTILWNKFYDENGIKHISSELINTLEPLGLAIWYMDDGSKCGNGYKISTNSFSKNDLENIRDMFLNKFSIEVNFHSDNSIYIPTKYSNSFKNLIESFIIDTMKYKL